MDDDEVKPVEDQINEAIPFGDMMMDFNAILKPLTIMLQSMAFIRSTLGKAGFREEYIETVCTLFFLHTNGKL